MSLKILAHAAGPDVRGAAHLEYRGYTISMSTIPSHPEIGIWHTDRDTVGGMHIIYGVSMESILEAKAYVDNIVDNGRENCAYEAREAYLERLGNDIENDELAC
jgi:hypothetical protein